MQKINFLKTRSFWMIAAAAVTTVTGVPVPTEVLEVLTTVAGGGEVPVQSVVPTVLAAGAYVERLRGKKKVVFGREWP